MNGLKLHYLLSDLQDVGGKVLDVGCGAGSVAKAVKRERPDLEVFGCDPSQSALGLAGASPEGVDFRLATAERLPFSDGEFDFVWIFDVLEHVDDPDQVLREVARVLRPGGGFHIVRPLEGQPWTLYRLVGLRDQVDGQSASWRPHPGVLGRSLRRHRVGLRSARSANALELSPTAAGARPSLLFLAGLARAGQRLCRGHVRITPRCCRQLDARRGQSGGLPRVGRSPALSLPTGRMWSLHVRAHPG